MARAWKSGGSDSDPTVLGDIWASALLSLQHLWNIAVVRDFKRFGVTFAIDDSKSEALHKLQKMAESENLQICEIWLVLHGEGGLKIQEFSRRT